jgi:hypothetical protein
MSYERYHSDNSLNQYMIGGVNLERVEVMTDLGVKFDSKLKFTDHINEKNQPGLHGVLGPEKFQIFI